MTSALSLLLPPGVPPVEHDAVEAALVGLYGAHYAELVRVAVLLVRDQETAEDIVQDAFVQMCRRWEKLEDRERAIGYLRASVVNGSRSALRHRSVAARAVHHETSHATGADEGALLVTRKDAVLAALQRLPRRQREVLVLRHYLDLSEAEIAHLLGISRGSVKTHASRGGAALRTILEEQR